MSNRKKIKKKRPPTRSEVIQGLQNDFAWLEEQEIRLKKEKEAEDARGRDDLSVSG